MENGMGNKRRGSCLWAAGLALGLGGLLLPALSVQAAHSVFLTVVGHPQEALNWCGPAAAQTVMAGYPASACVKDQADVAAAIDARKVEGNWDADPEGMRDATKTLCPPPGGGWAVVADASAQSVMFWVAYYMTHNHYPVALLLSTQAHNSYTAHQEHWVTIKGIVTDVEPTLPGPTTLTLQYVLFIDQPDRWAPDVIERFVSGDVWYGEFSAVTKTPSKYTGMFVALIEPPSVRGLARPSKELVVAGRIIPTGEASRSALQAVKALKLADMEAFRDFSTARPLEPLLVNPEHGGYYLVPFSIDGRTAALAVLINAYTGEFQEAGHFASRSFLPQGTALERLRTALRLRQPLRPTEVKPTLVSSPAAGTRYSPEWEITMANRRLRVDQRGVVHEARSP
jgi:hypothetical protein